MLVGYPLWWFVGVADIVPLIAAAIMAVHLIKMRRVTAQPGFGWWLLFLAWVVVGVLLLQVDAPSAIPDHSSTRYITFAFRLAWYLAATITMLYIYNMRGRLSTTRILRSFSWLFVTVVVFGVAATLKPNIDFPSLVEIVLPHGISHIQYVHDLIHPVMAQRYAVGGVVHPRASAPFAYTNDWGLNYACLLPFFVLSWLIRGNSRRRAAGVVLLLVSIYPVIMTQNRGAWVALVVVAVLIAARAWLFGRSRPLITVLVLGSALAAIVLATPLGGTIQNRLANGYSNAGRASLGKLTVDSALQAAPVVGFGSTRNVQGTFYSINGGDSSTCSICAPPALGTQGHFWLVIFSTGVGGLVLYLGFVGSQLVRALRRNTPLATAVMAVLIAHFATMFVYDTIGVALVTIFAAIGLLWRDSAEAQPGAPATGGRRDRRVGGYGRMLRANAVLVITCVAVGGAIGLAIDLRTPPVYTAETNISVPAAISYPGVGKTAQTLDTFADLIDTDPVRAAEAAAAGGAKLAARAQLSVTATANSQVLHILVKDTDPGRAQKISVAAAEALDHQRVLLQQQLQSDAIETLTNQGDILTWQINTIDVVGAAPGTALAAQRAQFADQLSANAAALGQLEGRFISAGTISVNPLVAATKDSGLVKGASGALLGLVIAVVIAFLRDMAGPAVGDRYDDQQVGGVWIMARLPAGADEAAGVHSAMHALLAAQVALAVSVGSAASTRAATAALNHALSERATYPLVDRVVLVAGPGTRSRQVARLSTALDKRGATVCGLVLAGQRPSKHPGRFTPTVTPHQLESATAARRD